MNKLFLSCLFLLLSLVIKSQDAISIFKNYVAATGTIYVSSKSESFQGSGFFISKTYFVTNKHVMDDFVKGYIKINNNDVIYKIDKIVKIDSVHDLAILKIVGSHWASVKLSKKEIKIGEKIYAISSPRGLEATITEGIVSSVRTVRPGSAFVQISASIAHGSSGAAIFNEIGEVIAIAVSGMDASYAQATNFAIPSNYLIEDWSSLNDFDPNDNINTEDVTNNLLPNKRKEVISFSDSTAFHLNNANKLFKYVYSAETEVVNKEEILKSIKNELDIAISFSPEDINTNWLYSQYYYNIGLDLKQKRETSDAKSYFEKAIPFGEKALMGLETGYKMTEKSRYKSVADLLQRIYKNLGQTKKMKWYQQKYDNAEKNFPN